jgi:hypothetical protein
LLSTHPMVHRPLLPSIRPYSLLKCWKKYHHSLSSSVVWVDNLQCSFGTCSLCFLLHFIFFVCLIVLATWKGMSMYPTTSSHTCNKRRRKKIVLLFWWSLIVSWMSSSYS